MELLLLRFRSWRERSRAVSVVVSWFMIVLKVVVVGGGCFARMRFDDVDEVFVGADVDFCCWVLVEGVVVVVGDSSLDMINDAML